MRKNKISYLSSCSSLSSLFGVSFRPPFLARGHPDKLEMVGNINGLTWRQTIGNYEDYEVSNVQEKLNIKK